MSFPLPWRNLRDTLLPPVVPGRAVARRQPAAGAEAAERATCRELKRALQRDALALHGQPVVDPRDGRVAGYEVLVRWEHPRRGRLLPGEFVPLAEKSDLIVDVDRWVVGHAIDYLRRWREHGYDGWLAVNVSVRSLENPSFVAELRDTLVATPELRGRLHLERTETAKPRRPRAVRSALADLRAAGARVSIDDFGTGFSSYGELLGLPFDTLKIDRLLLENIQHDPGAQETLRSLLRLGRSLGATVVAEGIETEGQRAWLAAEGGVLAQGYLLGKAEPLPGASPRLWVAP